jgi:hypothetical protein
MALGPFSASNHVKTSTVIAAYPLTVASWAYWLGSGNSTVYSESEPSGGTGDWITLGAGSNIGAASVNFSVNFGSALIACSTNTWNHGCGVWRSSSSRSAYLNGGSRTDDTTNVNVNLGGFTSLEFGSYRATQSGAGYFNGYLAGFGVWNVALDDNEIAALGKGFSPHLIRPQSLVHFIPGVRSSRDLKGSLVTTGALAPFPHPPIIGAIAA